MLFFKILILLENNSSETFDGLEVVIFIGQQESAKN